MRPLVFGIVLAFASAGAMAQSAIDCNIRQSEIQRQIGPAQSGGNAARTAGLQASLANARAQCSSNPALRAARDSAVRQRESEVLTRQRELRQAEAAQDMAQQAASRRRLNEANAQLNRERLRPAR